jgi:predicted nucleic acid-binding protein
VALAVVDASVFIAFRTRDDPHHNAAIAALTRHRGDDIVIPASAYAEALVDPTRMGGAVLQRAKQLVEDFPMRIVPVDRQIAERAAELRAEVRLPDALVLATGDVLRADVVLTADDRWRKVSRRVRVI